MDFGLLEPLLIGCIALALMRAKTSPRRTGWRGRIRDRGWGLALLPVALAGAALAGSRHVLAVTELAMAGALAARAPRLAAKIVPYAVLALAGYGFWLVRAYHDGFGDRVRYGFVIAGNYSWHTDLLLPEATMFGIMGLWLLVRVDVPGAGLVTAFMRRWLDPCRRVTPAQALLLLPVVALALQLLGPRTWFGVGAITGFAVAALDTLMVGASLILVLRSRTWAATLAEAALLILGGYGIAIATHWPGVPGFAYGFADLTGWRPAPPWVSGLEGTALLALGLWLVPRVVREHLRPGAELAARARQLTERVETLTRSRSVAVDTAAAELRRIERDLHDGAQARLVAVGMSLQAAERLFASNPEAALALVGEAKESSSRALTELRDLVRGIYPPVLADRGLGDAIRALALDTPLPVTVEADLPEQVELPVASAVYFSVAEALANVIKHADARSVRIGLSHRAGMLRAEITDDGAGGASTADGTGLAGVERRLATFDGILAVSSPPGGPTIVVIEVPCASSSAKTSSC